MYLKKIEIQGFKSFANKTLLEFHNGLTCIVGPNGSGKSNVADAVRWVLGEQNARQLRGSSMQDVIFSGTDARKPQGFASVSITFDNRDHVLKVEYDEVTVMRRVYRSGESEYLLNGAACRLRDIQELFFDTGIGKEGYSIIGQGQIDRILSSKPEDRRELFDEAAGIVTFKYRKTAALKKLDQEQASMLRLSDIMSELETQLPPLEKQAKTAREYLILKEGLKQYEMASFVMNTEQMEDSLEELKKRLLIVTGDCNDAEKEALQVKNRYESEQTALAALEQTIENNREALREAENGQKETDSQIQILKEQINTERFRSEHAKERLQILEEEIKDGKAEKEELQKKRQDLSCQIYDATAKRDAAEKEELRIAEEIKTLSEQTKQGRMDMLNLLDQKTELLTQREKYKTMLEQYKLQKAQFNKRLLLNQQEKTDAKQTISEHQTAWEHALAEKKKRQEAGLCLQAERNRVKQEQQALQAKITEARRCLQATETKKESLRNLAERYDGYGISIRKVMETKKQNPGICGVIADLIHAKKQYETAIETALGGSIQNIVTDTEQTAKHLITYLKQNRLGRATFLPLDAITIRDDFRQKEALREMGVIGLASALVETEKRYEKIAEFLLGRIVVVDTIDHAMKLAAKYHRSFRIVTLEGDLLNIGGSMTGGAFRNSSNLLSRGRELEELEEQGKQEAKQLAALEQAEKSIEETLLESGNAIKTLQEAYQEAALEETKTRIQYQTAKEQLEQLEQAYEQIILEQRLLEQSVAEAQKYDEEMLSRTEALEQTGEMLQNEQEHVQKCLEEKSAQREIHNKTYQEQELLLATLSQADRFQLETLTRIEKRLEDEKEEQKRIRAEAQASAEASSSKEQEIVALREQKAVLFEQDCFLKEKQNTLLAQKESLQKGMHQLFDEQNSIASRQNALEKDKMRLETQIERCETYLDEQTDYLWNEYEMKPSEAREAAKENTLSALELKKRIEEQKNKIKALGHINVNAIEEYRERKERWTFMKAQYDDLIISRDALTAVIEELDQGMRAQFEERFALIKAEFDRVFKELFGGGKGTLELVEGEDLLEAGVMIISQPPGKKLQNMMQLSGGEKALTAIALLFAIQNLKPSPFCLLDEIEAALDDSNVGRFAEYLHKLTKNTQFITITHRRGTMTSADRLYGITMQEKGVSALVSVNLVEQELKP